MGRLGLPLAACSPPTGDAGLVRLSASLGLPLPASLFQAGSRFLDAGLSPQDLLKAFPRLPSFLCFGPHFLVGHLAPHPLALPHLSPPCFHVTARRSLCGPPSPSPPFPVPCTVMSLPGRHLPLFSWSLSTSHQASADHHLPLEDFPDYLCQLCVPFPELCFLFFHTCSPPSDCL